MKIRMKMKIIITLILSHIFVTFSLAQSDYMEALKWCNSRQKVQSQECMIDENIFDFQGETIEGEMIDIGALKGKVLVINFWFISCHPCMAEIKGLNEIVDRYQGRDDVKFISFTLNNQKELDQLFFPKHQFKFEIIADAGTFLLDEIQHGWGYPTTFVVDKAGKIKKIICGGSTGEEEATIKVKEELIPILDSLLEK